jgi:glycosyltransferase involved in cell wall biosynthesis
MNNMPEFPKVLFITPCALNHITGSGVTFSSLFSGWPKERLACVTDNFVPVGKDVCENYYFLSPAERTFIRPFSWVYRQGKEAVSDKENRENTGPPAITRSNVFKFAKRIIGEAGIPDSGRLTRELNQWIKEFQPEVIFSILGTIGYIELVEQIQKEFSLPLVIHLMDDGVTDPRKKGIFGQYLRRHYNRKFRSLLKTAAARIAICEDMAEAYKERYGYSFVHFQHAVDIEKWGHYSKQDVSISSPVRVLYAGSIFPDAQLQSLKDCCQAVIDISREGLDILMEVYTPLKLFGSYSSAFPQGAAFNIHDSITEDENFFRTLGEADILVLPVNFDEESVNFIRYSMPTKVPAYLLSGTPILVYGPETVAQVRYALKEKWGHVISQRGVQHLKEGLLELIRNKELRQRLSSTAGRVAKKNHDAGVVRRQFQSVIINSSFSVSRDNKPRNV